MNRIKYFEETLARCEFALKQDPTMIPLEWIINQLRYLVDLEKGNVKDFSGLDKIKIGWIAVREMDGYEDKDLIHSLCVISSEVDKMILERGLPDDK
jgi:hypothetical protein